MQNLTNTGKIAPNAIESEAILLGAWMHKTGMDWIDKTRPEWFFNVDNQKICRAIQKLYTNNEPIDLITVYKEADVEAYCVGSISGGYTGESPSRHWAFIRTAWTERSLMQILNKFYDLTNEGENDVFQLINQISADMDELNLTESGQISPLSTLLDIQIDNLAERMKNTFKTVGMRSGFETLDRHTGGVVKGEFMVVAGRPGMGKTAFAVSYGIRHAQLGGHVVMFSMEMSKEQLADRILAMAGGVDNRRIRSAEISDQELQQIIDGSFEMNVPFFIEDSTRLTIDQIRARVKTMQPRPTAVIIDYMQLVPSTGGRNREQEIAHISRSCKLMAKDCDTAVIALSQLNRETEAGNSRPKLSNLRESGAIEQDADTVLFPYRPAYYRALQGEAIPEIEDDAEVIIGKCRNGITGSVGAKFRGKTVEYLP